MNFKEQVLPKNASCNLGSFNLTQFVIDPFTDDAKFDFDSLKKLIPIAVRMMDNVIDITNYPLEIQKEESQSKRRIGIGITGLADALIMLKRKYSDSLDIVEEIMSTLANYAYLASSELAVEKEIFPLYNKVEYLKSNHLKRLDDSTIEQISKFGMRNSHLLSIQPCGTISLLAGNVSSGLEPVFAYRYDRKIRKTIETDTYTVEVQDYAYAEYIKNVNNTEDLLLPEYFQTTDSLTPNDHIQMQAVIQKYVCSSCSKTVNVPENISFDDFKEIYMDAWKAKLKGITTFKPSKYITGVLTKKEEPKKEETKTPVEVTTNDLLSRPSSLGGCTYKIKCPLVSSSFYVTINDIIMDNKVRPYEVFINTKDLNHYSWVVTVSRLLSTVLRKSDNPSFLVKELKSIYDPNGGYFDKGKYVPSISAAIGFILEEHLIRLGMLKENKTTKPADVEIKELDNNTMMICPMCNEKTLINQENCLKCLNCDYSKCQ